MISSFLILIRKYKNAISIEKLQIRYIFIGTYLSVVGASITNLIIPYITENWRLSRYGPYFTIFLVVFTTYAILKHHLFNLKVIATELLVGLVAIILLIDLLVSKDTSTILFKLAIFTLFAYLGISLIQSVLKEIKRREQMEVMALKLQRAYEDLKQLDKTKTEFLSMASHQLRTPLSAIKGYVSMILEGSYGKLPEKAKQKLENVFISNERLIDIINDLLDISKAELGKMELNKKSLQIEDLITSVYEEMKIRAEEKHLQFILEKPPVPLPKIEVDELKIRQVISNVVDNALKYTQEGKIEIKVNRTDSIIQVSVADTGAGLTPEEIKAVFGGFARGSAGIDFFIEGTGLGLYVAKKYLELHKGKIWAESEGKGKGSTFYIELPINPVDNGTK